jgi:pyruvate formate lyase activating enzyme
MPFCRVTFSEKYERCCVYNFGCNFSCRTCIYQVKKPGRPERFLKPGELRNVLSAYAGHIRRVHFLGGEPTTDPALPGILAFIRSDLGLETVLGHTNGSRLDLPHLDRANVGVKAFSPDLHVWLTGRPKSLVYDSLVRAQARGIALKVNIVFVPDLVGIEEITGLAEWLAALDPAIPLHVQGYFAVPDRPWREPTPAELHGAVEAASRHVQTVTSSVIDRERIYEPWKKDDRFVAQTLWP